jgi:hypothetical protein
MKKKNGYTVLFSTKSKKNGKLYTGIKTGATTTVGFIVFDEKVLMQTTKTFKKGTAIVLPKGVAIVDGEVRRVK